MYRSAFAAAALIAAAVAVPAAGAQTSAPAAAQAAATPLEAFAALPLMSSLAVSPTGAELAWLDRSEGGTRVRARGRSGGDLLIDVDVSDRTVRGVFWASPDHVGILTTVLDQTPLGYGQWTIMDLVNVRTGRAARALSEAERRTFPLIGGYMPGTYRGEPVLYVEGFGEVSRGGYAYNLYRVDLDNGRARTHEEGVENVTGFLVRPTGEVAARVTYVAEDGRWKLAARTGSGWREVYATRALLDPPSLMGFGRTPDTVAFSGEVDGKATVTHVGLLAEHQVDPIILPDRPNAAFRDGAGTIVGLGFYGSGQQYVFFDPAIQAAWSRVSGAFAGKQVTISDHSQDYKVFTLFVTGPNEPGSYYLFDAERGAVSLVRRTMPAVTQVAEVRAVSYTAADGTPIEAFLTLPPGRDPKNLPLIMHPHGGPQARDELGFDWWAQAMASRGYAVLQPNFRGSEGYGQAFIEAGFGEWGKKMQSDLTDGVRWLAEQGTIDPSRVCIVGSSYGGYAALAGMTLDVGTYRCAVSVSGVSDLRAMLREEERQGLAGRKNPVIRYWNRFMGGTGSGDRTLDQRSPAMLADKVEGPVLLIHGRNDTVVPYEQSEIMERALRAAGKPVRLVPLEGEDHHLTYAPTRRQTLEATVAFLEQHNPPQ